MLQRTHANYNTYTGRNRMFPYFWNVAEICNSMFPLYLSLAETWKFKSAWFRHVSGTETSSHVSVIFQPADFRCCSFPSCFCKRICIMVYEPLYHFWGSFILSLVYFSIFWGRFNKTIIPFELVGYELGYRKLGLTGLVGYLPSHIQRALME